MEGIFIIPFFDFLILIKRVRATLLFEVYIFLVALAVVIVSSRFCKAIFVQCQLSLVFSYLIYTGRLFQNRHFRILFC